MLEELTIDRDAIVEVHRTQNLDAMHALVARGELTQQEADQLHRIYMGSDILQMLVTRDVQTMEAMLEGQVH